MTLQIMIEAILHSSTSRAHIISFNLKQYSYPENVIILLSL